MSIKVKVLAGLMIVAAFVLGFLILYGIAELNYLIWQKALQPQSQPHAHTVSFIINDEWVSAFFNAVNTVRAAYRVPQLQECPALMQFAEMRLRTLEADHHLSVAHYGFYNDYAKFLKEYNISAYEFQAGEEVLFPDTPNATSYLYELLAYAPVHFFFLVNSSNMRYYGYAYNYTTILEPIGENCPTEITTPGINITLYMLLNGCEVTWVKGNILVVELANICPS